MVGDTQGIRPWQARAVLASCSIVELPGYHIGFHRHRRVSGVPGPISGGALVEVLGPMPYVLILSEQGIHIIM